MNKKLLIVCLSIFTFASANAVKSADTTTTTTTTNPITTNFWNTAVQTPRWSGFNTQMPYCPYYHRPTYMPYSTQTTTDANGNKQIVTNSYPPSWHWRNWNTWNNGYNPYNNNYGRYYYPPYSTTNTTTGTGSGILRSLLGWN